MKAIYRHKYVCVALFVLIFLIYFSLSYGEAKQSTSLYRKEISPKGDITVLFSYNRLKDTNEIWLSDGKNKKLLYTYIRAAHVVFDPEQERIAVNDDYGSNVAKVILFEHVTGLEYKQNKIDLNTLIGEYFLTVNKIPHYSGAGDHMFSHHYVRGVQWIDNCLLVLEFEGHGMGDGYVDRWYCIYDFVHNKLLVDLSDVNKYSIHLKDGFRKRMAP